MKTLELTKAQNEKLERVINQECTEHVFVRMLDNGKVHIRAIWEEKEPKIYSNGKIGKYVRANYIVGKRGACESSMDLYQPEMIVGDYKKVK